MLLKAEVEEITLSECKYNFTSVFDSDKNVFRLSEGIKETMICARNRKSKADTCKGKYKN